MEITMTDFIAVVSLLISIWLAIYNWYNSNRLKKLESNLEIQKNKSLLNDKRSREAFDNFIELYIELLFNKKSNGNLNEKDKIKKEKEQTEKIEKIMLELKKIIFINWDWEIVNEFNNFMLISKTKDTKKLFESFEKLVRLFRKNIWVNNDWLKKFSILQIFINEDVNNISYLK